MKFTKRREIVRIYRQLHRRGKTKFPAAEIAANTGAKIGYVRNVLMDIRRRGRALSASDERYYAAHSESKRAKRRALYRRKKASTLPTARNVGIKVPWKTTEIARLLEERDLGTPTEQIAKRLQRTYGSVSMALSRFSDFFENKQKSA